MFWYVQTTATKCTVSNAYKYKLMQPRKEKFINYFNILLDFEISRKPGLFRNSTYIGVLTVFIISAFHLQWARTYQLDIETIFFHRSILSFLNWVLCSFQFLNPSCCSTLGIIYSCSDIPFSFKQVPNLPKFHIHQALAHKDYFVRHKSKVVLLDKHNALSCVCKRVVNF